MRKGGWLLGLAAFVAGQPAALAQPSNQRLELSWHAPDECPGDVPFLRAVEGFLGQALEVTSNQQLTIDVQVTGDRARGYVAKLSFTRREGTTVRELEHPECGKLSEAAALLTALAIDPERVSSVRELSAALSEPSAVERPSLNASAPTMPPSPPPRPAGTSITTHDALSRREENSSGHPLRVSMALSGLAATGLLPTTGPGIGAELALGWRSFEAALAARYWLSRSVAIAGTPSATVELSLVTAALRLCLARQRDAWSVSVCARADLGEMSGHGQGVDNERARGDLYAAAGGSVLGAYALGRLSPLAGVEALGLGRRPRFGVLRNGQEQQVFRPRSWQLTGFVGLAYQL